MTDSMKFGPEWIRTLSESGPIGLNSQPASSSHSGQGMPMPQGPSGGPHHHGGHPPPPSPHIHQAASMSGRYTLAEHRYGREEMLALYSSSLGPPESLKTLTGLYVEKSQQPLALFSFTDDEIRIWNRGVNPDGLGRGSAGKGAGEGSVRGRRESTGREGRGRGRGGAPPGTYFPRPPGSNVYPGDMGEQSADPNQPIQPFNRNRPPFERQGDRSWSERNGGGDGGGRGRMGGDTNWRRHRGDSEDGTGSGSGSGDTTIPGNNNPGWRPQAKWQNQGRNWRDEDSWTDRDPRMSNSHLPEWAMEKNEGGGSFDASGAFHGHEVDDELPVKRRDKNLHHEQKSKSESSDVGDAGGGGSDGGSTDRMHELGDKDMCGGQMGLPLSLAMGDSDRRRDQDQPSPSFGLDEIKKQVEKRLKGDEEALELSEIKRQLELLERQQQMGTKQSHQGGIDPTAQLKDLGNQIGGAGVQVQSQSQPGGEAMPQSQQGMPNIQPTQLAMSPQNQSVQIPVQSQSGPQLLLPSQQQSSNLQQGQAGVLLGQTVQGGNPLVMLAAQQQVQMGVRPSGPLAQQMSPMEAAQHQIHQPLAPPMAHQHQAPPSQQPMLHDSHMDDHNINDNIATDLVAKLMEEEEKRDKQWYYKDPQGQVQGPFSCGEMAEWFQSGYFTLGLMVKRACDPSFSPLGELIKIWGCIPFLAEQGGGGGGGNGGGGNTATVPTQPPQPDKEHQPGPPPPPHQVNPQMQDTMLHQQIKMDHYRQHQLQQQLILRQQQQAASMANRNQVKMPPTEWSDHLPQQESQQGGQQASLQLRALLAQMQAHQHLKQQQQSGKVKESSGSSGGGGPGGVMETLMSLHQQQVAQQQALQQALQAAQLAEAQGSSQGNATGGGAAASIRTLVSQMQQGKLRMNSQPTNIDSVWNGGNSWNKWSHVNPKAFKTEQQVLEEQMRAEDERKREELRKQEEVVRITEEECKDRNRDKQEERVHNERNKRESEELHRRRLEEEELRRKQEAARRAEVERQRKEEDKRKKEEDKRRKDEEKRKQAEERERLKLEHDRNKKESEEAKKHQDLMNKIQRDQWCPPQASNTSLLEIQRSEREQQVLRSLRDQEAVAAAAAAAAAEKSSLRLKWTETSRSAPFLVESLADIQAQQYRQLMKVQEKEKADREKKEAAASQQVGGTWSQGLNWGALPQQPVWHNNQGGAGGFWDQLSGPKLVSSSNLVVGAKVTSKPIPVSNAASAQVQQQQVSKESKSKAKREEMAVMQLFGSQARQDEFTKWCQQTLANLPMTCPYDIPTFVSFLREIESGPDVLEYVRGYVGESKEAAEFARQFLERRHSLMQSQGGQTPTLAQVQSQPLCPQSNEDFQQVKSKGKNKKKGRVSKMHVDPRILGFSSTASPDRINVGDREYPEDL